MTGRAAAFGAGAATAPAGREDAAHATQPSRALLVVAFASVYLAWGSTYLAIRIAVASVAPPILAGVRFTVAGAGLLLTLRLAGRPVLPDARALGALAI